MGGNEINTWRRASELPTTVFQILQKKGGILNPSSVIASIDEDGSPRTAPFGSLHAITPTRMRIVVNRHHDTLSNIRRDPRIMIFLANPPDMAMSIKGKTRIVNDPWSFDSNYAVVEIDIVEIKNDLPREISIESGLQISASGPFHQWWQSCWKELHVV